MRVLVDINHPAHVHLFKYLIEELHQGGHVVKITSRKKDITLELLNNYGFEYSLLSHKKTGFMGLALEYSERLRGIYRISNEFEPDVMIGLNPAIAHVSKVTDSSSIILHDTEPAALKEWMFSPFADLILTPNCFEKNLGRNHKRYEGYHELAYLHPKRFTPEPAALDPLPVNSEDKFALIRLVSWSASHDFGDNGIADINRVINKFEQLGVEVLISSEDKLPPELEQYKVHLDPTKIHHVLNYADVFFGESATMATESAVLGTPAVFVSTSTRGYVNELEEYGLVFRYSGEDRTRKGLQRTVKLLKSDIDWEQKRKHMLKEKQDVTNTLLKYVIDSV